MTADKNAPRVILEPPVDSESCSARQNAQSQHPVVPLELSSSEHSSACFMQRSCVAFAYLHSCPREGFMGTISSCFAHVLLFACPKCGIPLASACASTERNLETADAHWFNPHCPCGWTGSVTGLHATKHWVEEWRIPVNLGPDAAGSCDSESRS
jgi:hypothetical protein